MSVCRVFLSYRGKSEGKEFSEKLYNYIKADPYSNEKYGEVYYSPESAGGGDNFVRDIPDFINDGTEYFVMPLTEDYFKNFWDSENDCPNPRSVTHKEITQALKTDCRFVCIRFSDTFKLDEALLHKLYGDESERIISSVKISADISEVASQIARKDLSGADEYLKQEKSNVYLTFRTEADSYPFYAMMNDVKRITLMNLASSSFIRASVAGSYKKSIMDWFSDQLKSGAIEADIILTHPYSDAAADAVDYKMYPNRLNGSKADIIPKNLNNLYWAMRENPDAKLNLYLTPIALPYGVMITEHNNTKNNHLKVDLYSPVISSDNTRPSFYLRSTNDSTKNMYDFLVNNVMAVKNDPHTVRFNGNVSVPWLLGSENGDKPIIHRGVANKKLKPHTKKAFRTCLEKNLPIEVDLIELKDGNIVVGRDDEPLPEYGDITCLSQCKTRDIKKINALLDDPCKIMLFDEFLDFVHGNVPLLIEIKTKGLEVNEKLEEFISNVVSKLREYAKKFDVFTPGTSTSGFAVHSSNPYVLQAIKKIDCLIPCGIISTDFTKLKDKGEVDDEFFNLHDTCDFEEIIRPDFICYDLRYLDNNKAKKFKKKYNVPVIAWTVVDEDTEEEVLSHSECDNYIIEGATTYIDD